MFTPIVLLLIPWLCFFTIRSRLLGYLVAVAIGCVLMTGNAIYMEGNAIDSDFDFVFGVGLIFWNGVLVLFYTACFGVMYLFDRFFLQRLRLGRKR